jgi:hypothetical protein
MRAFNRSSVSAFDDKNEFNKARVSAFRRGEEPADETGESVLDMMMAGKNRSAKF